MLTSIVWRCAHEGLCRSITHDASLEVIPIAPSFNCSAGGSAAHPQSAGIGTLLHARVCPFREVAVNIER